jgi:hypothetical protein
LPSDELSVTLSKLKKYVEEQGGYDLYEESGEVILTFVPSFPEALEKSDGASPRVVMHGRVHEGKVTFEKIKVEEEREIRTKDLEDAKLAYGAWLGFIEENY